MTLTYYGHSCFAVTIAETTLLFDPFIRPNAKAAHIDFKQIEATYILISHGHEDHLADAVDLAQQTGAAVIAGFEVAEWLGKQGVHKVHGMNLGGAFEFPFGRVKMIPAIHSSVLPDGTAGGNPGGFLIESAAGNFLFSGDTALTRDYELHAEANLKFAVLCIGDNFTMGSKDAARAANFLQCDTVVGVHYDTFPPIVIDPNRAKADFEQRGVTLLLPPIGGRIDL